jgi:hypothetical protein
MIPRDVTFKIEGVEQLVLRTTLLTHHFDCLSSSLACDLKTSASLRKFGEFFKHNRSLSDYHARL